MNNLKIKIDDILLLIPKKKRRRGKVSGYKQCGELRGKNNTVHISHNIKNLPNVKEYKEYINGGTPYYSIENYMWTPMRHYETCDNFWARG